MKATAAPPYSGLNASATSTPPVAAAAAPRATIMTFFSGTRALTGTGTNVITSPTPAVSQAPATGTGTGTGEAPAALAATPNAPAKGPEASSAAAESPATTIATSGETMLPGERHECQDNVGEDLFSEPPNKKGKRTYGKLELKLANIGNSAGIW